MGASPYGAYGSSYSSPYGTPYSRYGSYGGAYGGGAYGGYGGGYGGMYGGGMGGGMYGGMPGMPGDPNDPNTLTNRFNTSTQATFQMMQGIVGAFGGFAQMLDSTLMATHSSFFGMSAFDFDVWLVSWPPANTITAMISVAEQFGNLRDTLGSVLGIFTLMRWIRTLIAKVTGRPPPADATALTPAAFARFEGRSLPSPDGTPAPPKPNRKPIIFFVLAAFGLPYLMSKMIKTLAASHEEEEKRRMALMQQQQLDPAKLEFCRALYDFTPEQNAAGAVQGVDLAVKKGDFVAVLSKSDPLGNPSEWWQCRSRDGRVGYLPSNYLAVARRSGQPLAAITSGADDSSRTNSLASNVTRAHTLKSDITEPAPAHAMPPTRPGDVTADSFQRSAFYS